MTEKNETSMTTKSLTDIEKDKETKAIRVVADEMTVAIEHLPVTNEEQNELASISLLEGQKLLKTIDVRRRFFTDPHNLFVKAINNFFGESSEPLERAVLGLRSRMGVYFQKAEQEARAKQAAILKKQAEEEEAIRNRQESGKLKESTAEAKIGASNEAAAQQLAEIEKPKEVVRTEGGSVSFRVVKKVRVTDVTKLPREFLVPDLKFIEAALKSGRDVPGAELYEEKTPVSRGVRGF